MLWRGLSTRRASCAVFFNTTTRNASQYLYRWRAKPRVEDMLTVNPSVEYLATASQPSQLIKDPSSHRKLLVLDLNGTLVYRTPSSSGLRMRPAYPRPFMPSFASYLAHPDTRKWLETMVWSSARPKNVAAMVNTCFGVKREQAVAVVWTRDEMGLTDAAYRADSETLKDLERAWLYTFGHGQIRKHSALSTLLLDDSVRKAALQPYNHVCIQDYTQKLRSADVERAKYLTLQSQKDNSATDVSIRQIGDKIDTNSPVDDGSGAAVLSETDPRQARRKEKKERKRAEKAARKSEIETSHQEPPPFDNMLLAVIGILDAVKWESNVAGWIHAGGLHGEPSYAGNNADGPGLLQDTQGASEKTPKRGLWFEDKAVCNGWVAQGKRVLEELGIPLVDGLTQ